MPQLLPDVPVVVTEPLLQVDLGAAAHLPVGKHRVKLVVVDDAGIPSEPAWVTVKIVSPDKPTAILELVDDADAVLEPKVAAGQPFRLSGADSHEHGGEIVAWRFTLVAGS